jgi:hypothetical protein
MLRCRNAILYLSLIDRNKFQQEGGGIIVRLLYRGKSKTVTRFFHGVRSCEVNCPNQTEAEFVAIEINMMRGNM